MSIKIRLRRMGRKKQAHYRIVVADTDAPRDGRFVESLGYYKPLSQPARLVLDMDRVDYWEKQGAKPSDTVANLVKQARKGGGDWVALGEVDKEAEKQAKQEALAAKRRAEAEALAKEEAEAEAAKKAEKKAAEKAEKAEAEGAEPAEEPAGEAAEAGSQDEGAEAKAEEESAEPEAEGKEEPKKKGGKSEAKAEDDEEKKSD